MSIIPLLQIFFDNGLVDAYLMSKNWSSLNEVRKLKDKLYDLRFQLVNSYFISHKIYYPYRHHTYFFV